MRVDPVVLRETVFYRSRNPSSFVHITLALPPRRKTNGHPLATRPRRERESFVTCRQSTRLKNAIQNCCGRCVECFFSFKTECLEASRQNARGMLNNMSTDATLSEYLYPNALGRACTIGCATGEREKEISE